MPNERYIALIERDESGVIVASYGQSTSGMRAAVSAPGPGTKLRDREIARVLAAPPLGING